MSKYKRALTGNVTPAPKRIAPKVYTYAEVQALERISDFPGKKFERAEAHFGYFMKLERERARRRVRCVQRGSAA